MDALRPLLILGLKKIVS